MYICNANAELEISECILEVIFDFNNTYNYDMATRKKNGIEKSVDDLAPAPLIGRPEIISH
jgi:hypothetical protein